MTSILTNSKFKISKFKFSNIQITRPGFHFEVPKNIKLRQKQFHMNDTGKSSSRKLRRVIYYTLYRMDPQNAHYKISFSPKMSNIEIWGKNRIYFPPNSRSTAPLRRLFMLNKLPQTTSRTSPLNSHCQSFDGPTPLTRAAAQRWTFNSWLEFLQIKIAAAGCRL